MKLLRSKAVKVHIHGKVHKVGKPVRNAHPREEVKEASKVSVKKRRKVVENDEENGEMSDPPNGWKRRELPLPTR